MLLGKLLSPTTIRALLLIGIAASVLFLGGVKAEAATLAWQALTPTQECVRIFPRVIEGEFVSWISGGERYTVPAGYTVSGPYERDDAPPYYLSCGPVIMAALGSFFAASDKDIYAPGETATVSVAATIGDAGGSRNFFDYIFNPFCIFGCSSIGGVGASATYINTIVYCDASGSCSNTGSFRVPSRPGSYAIVLNGCVPGTCAPASIAFTVSAAAAAAVVTPAATCAANQGSACSSASNACGQTTSGTIQCDGSCSVSAAPANPAGYGGACTSAANACGQTQANGTIQCNGSCSSTPPPDSSCPIPDLTAGSTTASPASGTPGQSESFSATVSNSGTGSASNFPNIFQIANSSLSSTLAMLSAGTISSLAAGASTGISGAYTFSSAGSYNVRACANFNTSWGGSVSESNTNNNCGAWLPLTVAYPALSASCSGAPGNPYVGQTVTWSSSVSGGSGSRTYSWSGTESLSGTSASVQKTYATIGQKSATLTVTDSLSGQVVPATCSTGANQSNGPANGGAGGSGVGVGSCVASFSVSPSTVEQGENTTISWSVAGGSFCASSCSGSGFNTGGATSGSAAASVLPAPPTTAYALTCSGGTYGPPPPANATVTVLVPTAALTANGQSSTTRVNPSTPNNTTVAWSSTNSASCAVTKNGAAWRTGLSSAGITETVTTQTVYAIDCVNNHSVHATGSVTVNVLAGFEEF